MHSVELAEERCRDECRAVRGSDVSTKRCDWQECHCSMAVWPLYGRSLGVTQQGFTRS